MTQILLWKLPQMEGGYSVKNWTLINGTGERKMTRRGLFRVKLNTYNLREDTIPC